MKVLLVNKFHYLRGGSEKYYFELGNLLQENGHEVAFFSMKDDKNIKTNCKEYFVDKIDLNTGSKLKALDVIYSRKNKKKMELALDEFKPDIVHINNFQRQLSASIIKPIKKRNIPIVFTAHDMNSVCPASLMLYKGEICEDCITKGYSSCIKKNCIKNSKLKSILGVLETKFYQKNKIFKQIDYIIAPSAFIKKQLTKGNLEYNKMEVVHNFVLKSPETESKENVDKGYAFFFGRLSKEKGVLNLIKAFEKLSSGNLVIAGNGEEKEKIKNYIKDNKLEDKISLVGYLKQEQVRKYIRECKFVVVPSICYENCPYSIIETMEIGKPIIGSKIGGISELIQDGENGFLYKYNDVNSLADKMQKLFDNPNLVKKFSQKSKKLFEKNYTADIYYKNIIEIYQNLIKEKQQCKKKS